MYRIKCAALVAGMALACAAHAESFFAVEVSLGGSAYEHGPNGLWYQDGFQHRFDLTAPAIEAGFTGDLYQAEHWGLSWHLDYAWLGMIHTQAMATPSDQNYNANSPNHCNGSCWPLANYLGSGHDSGFMFTLEPHLDWGGWRFGVEGGPYYHRNTWAMNVEGWVPTPTATPTNISVQNNRRWQLDYVVGASVGYKNVSLSYQYFHNGSPVTASDPYPPIWKNTHVLLLRYRANVF
jgi:hypothetical protein